MTETRSEEIEFALDAIQKAAGLARAIEREMTGESLTKQDKSPVTVADFSIQALLGHLLQESFPDDPLVAEESAAQLREPDGKETLKNVVSFTRQLLPEANEDRVCQWIERGTADPERRFWTLDPVDGTKGFLRGDQYACALALIEEGDVKLGVLGAPNLTNCARENPGQSGTIAAAERGKGAWHRPAFEEGPEQPLEVSDSNDMTQAVILRSFVSSHTNEELMDAIVDQLAIQPDPLPMDSQAKYGVLAAGRGDLYFRLLSPTRPEYSERIWDQAPGSIIVEEAGGKVTDLDGHPLDFTTGRKLTGNRGILASNGTLHEQAVDALKTLMN